MLFQVVPSFDQLRVCPLFTDLDEETLRRVQPLATVRQVAAKRFLMGTELPGDFVYVLLSGRVKVTGEQADGSIVLRAMLSRGQLIGEIAVLDRLARTATVQTIESSKLICFRDEDFERCLLLDAHIPLQLSRLLAQRLRCSIDRFHSLATENARTRVARLLLQFAEEQQVAQRDGVLFKLPLSQEDLASMVGISRGHFIAVLQDLRKECVLGKSPPGEVMIQSWDGLRRIVVGVLV